jgi:MoxR-like ATPase
VSEWLIYRGTRVPHDGINEQLPEPPKWRQFRGEPWVDPPSAADESLERRLGDLARATTYRASVEEIDLVNAALYLRRPLLVTGNPGTGKSTLAYSVAHELKMGRVLKWPITSRSTREEGLYQYDALARLQDASRESRQEELRRLDTFGQLRRPELITGNAPGAAGDLAPAADDHRADYKDIGRYIRLGPLGTALLPYQRPRMLLIDELDKSDIDLPNDLLTTFEDGQYEIRELSRIADQLPVAEVMTDDGSKVAVTGGKIECSAFPLVIVTSNGEREFPPAFLRRCLRLHIEVPKPDRLLDIVQAHLGTDGAEQSRDLIETFISRREHGDLATDQLLNAIYLMFNHAWPEGRDKLVDKVFQYISQNPE